MCCSFGRASQHGRKWSGQCRRQLLVCWRLDLHQVCPIPSIVTRYVSSDLCCDCALKRLSLFSTLTRENHILTRCMPDCATFARIRMNPPPKADSNIDAQANRGYTSFRVTYYWFGNLRNVVGVVVAWKICIWIRSFKKMLSGLGVHG